MEIDNKISKRINIAASKEKYDSCCKRLLSIKIILAHILKSCLEEFKDFEPYDIAEKYIEGDPMISGVSVHQDEDGSVIGMNTEDSSINEGTVRYDILFYAYVPVLNETVKLIINVEAQNKFKPGYSLLKRAVYYCSRLISAQYNTEFKEESYDGIKKVFSIWICTNPSAEKRNTITRFSFNQNNLVGGAKYDIKEYDLIEIVMVCLGRNGENYSGIIRLLNVLFSSKLQPTEMKQILEEEYNIKMTKTIEKEVLGMCNVSEGIYEEGIAKGMEKGIEEGTEKTKIGDIRKIMKNFGMTLEQALKGLEIPETEYAKYRKLIEE